MQHNSTSPVRVARAAKAEKASALRAEGKSYRAIARELGISLGEAHALVRDAMRRCWERAADHLDSYLASECERLDALIEAHWEKATHEADPDCGHAQVVLKASDQKHRLRGAYLQRDPVRVNVTSVTVADPREAEAEFLRLGLTKPKLPAPLEVVDGTLAPPSANG